MKLASKIAFIGLLLGVSVTSCHKKECSEVVPEMEFLSFKPSQVDSGYFILTFSFKDCDGDVGKDAGQSIMDENGEIQKSNFMIDLYHVVNNQWVKHEFNQDDAGLDDNIPVLNNGATNPILDGEVDKRLHKDFALLGYDSVKFVSKILDNQGHYSNEVETPGFVIQ